MNDYVIVIVPDSEMDDGEIKALELKKALNEHLPDSDIYISKIGDTLYESEDFAIELSEEKNPDLIISIGMANLLIGLLPQYNRVMLNPSYNNSLSVEESCNGKLSNRKDNPSESQLYELDSPGHFQRGKRSMIALFDGSMDDKESMDVCLARHITYKVSEHFDIYNVQDLPYIRDEIINFLKTLS